MPETRPPIALKGISLADLKRLIGERRTPPVERWDPPYCGHSGMRIARDGTWTHDGRPIARPAMIRLFSTILRREADSTHVLVTPVEKLGIDVDCTAFRAVEMTTSGSGENREVALSLDSGDALIVGAEHPLRMADDPNDPSPRVAVRHGLEAELSRPIYYELAEIALSEGADPPGIWSGGCFFPMASSQ